MYKTVLKTLMISCIVYGNCFAFADTVRSMADVFGRGSASWSPDAAFKAVDRVEVDIPCLDDKNTALWNTELPEDGKNEPFEIKGTGVDRTLRIKTGDMRPAFTTVRILIDGGTAAAGAAWARAKAENVVFMCRPDKDIRMTFHLLVRGRTAGTYQAGFSAAGGRWNLVVLPMSAFGLRTFSSVAGIGFRSVDGQPDATVEFKDFKAVRLPFSDSMWSRRVLSVSLNGAWKFATDPGEKGVAGKWFAKDFNDAGWDVISSGNSWEAQGYDHYGWGWYRCGVFLPDTVRGVPLKLSLGSIQSDDEVWFNGVRIGGISSEYKYDNMMQREYIVPPELIRPGETNSIAVRIWGGNLTFIGSKSGLVKGLFQLSADPYEPLFSKAGTAEGSPCGSFDMSNAIRGMPFGIRVRFPEEIVNAGGADAGYIVEDMLGVKISGGNAPVKASGGAGEFLVNFNGEDSRSVYFSGRFRISFTVYGSDGAPLYCSGRVFDKLNFSARDSLCLPELKDTYEDTPYGKLKLVDVIDCSVPPEKEVHPFMQGGYDNRAARMTPGAFYRSDVESILGKRARTGGYGWFAYRIGRGKLKEHGMYLLRIEYPEDKPRFCPVEVQVGQNYSDIGWKNGVGPGDVYDDWPLSGKWEWFDTIVPMDGKTVGSGGTGSASSENGFWVYFMNKMRPGMYYAMWQGGPAVASMKLYEIDAVKNAPVIRRPEGARQRTLALDWERQPDHDPEDIIRYSKLMGYSAISPLILKWAFANYGEAIDGYDTMQIDPRDYWVHRDYAEGKKAAPPYPGLKSQHLRYLEATKELGIDYIPRIEWGGSNLLPEEARAIGSDGKPAKPNRFARWCANILHPETWEDFKRYLDKQIMPYAKKYPQMKGIHWRIRCNRTPVSYGADDIKMFSEETCTPLPGGRYEQWAAWASGECKDAYDTWWHEKRAAFHAKIVEYLRSANPDMQLYYLNWDMDKFGIVEPDLTAWAFVSSVVKPAPEGGRAAYEKEREIRKSLTVNDYKYVLHSGNFGRAFNGINRADIGIRPELYKDIPGVEIFAPVNYKCYADMPEYFEYFKTHDGCAVSHMVSYDEIGSRVINPKYEGNMIVPGGPDFSMALELLSWFYSDAVTINFTVYTYARGFADAHRRFAQAFLALPAVEGLEVPQGDADVKLRVYEIGKSKYIGVGYKGYKGKDLVLRIPYTGSGKSASLEDLVTGETIKCAVEDGSIVLRLNSRPMQLHSFRQL